MARRAARWAGWPLGVALLVCCGDDILGDHGATPSVDGGDTDGSTSPSDGGVPDGTDGADAASRPPLYLFVGSPKSGAIGGRAGADALCESAREAAAIAFTTTRALLSVTADDEIRDMPSNYGVPTDRPVVSFTGVTLANDWADLLDGSIPLPLQDAGVLDGLFWYSGSNADGSLAERDGGVPYTCSEWTDGEASLDGAYGWTQRSDDRWMHASQATCGLDFYRVLCLGWNP